MHRDGKGGSTFLEIDIQSVFIRFLIFDRFDRREFLDQLLNVLLEILMIAGVTDPEIAKGMSLFFLGLREAPHGAKKTGHLLDMMANVIGFSSDLHHHME
ncbi:MAG: Uncharacterised protein [Flavobacteriia bacterium]|nr:MAG: Uncharacterised protein [Flavobacteriia bacterium]